MICQNVYSRLFVLQDSQSVHRKGHLTISGSSHIYGGSKLREVKRCIGKRIKMEINEVGVDLGYREREREDRSLEFVAEEIDQNIEASMYQQELSSWDQQLYLQGGKEEPYSWEKMMLPDFYQNIKLEENKEQKSKNKIYQIQNMPQNLIPDVSPSLKKKLNHKIQQILLRRSHISSTTQQSFHPYMTNNQKTRKGRNRITREVIQKLKIVFEQYNQTRTNPDGPKMTFNDMVAKTGISKSQLHKMYGEFCKDPLFIGRVSKMQEGSQYASIKNTQGLTRMRIRFIKDLVSKQNTINQKEIAQEMSKHPQFLIKTQEGIPVPISRQNINKLMKIGNISQKTPANIPQIILNDPNCIKNRLTYIKRYLEITQKQKSDIYFLGQYSFASSMSLGICQSFRTNQFVKGRLGDTNNKSVKSQDVQLGKKIQFLIVISLQGVIYFQIFDNIFQELNFDLTLTKIGIKMISRQLDTQKYLILDTSFLHKKDSLRTFEKNFPVKVLFIPPKSSMLNPCEYVFSELKSTVKTKSYKSKRSYAECLSEVLNMNYSQRRMDNYYLCIKPYVELALRQKPFK